MGLFLVFWCATIARAILRDNSRFGAINSRLRGNKFPFGRRRELVGNGLIYFILFGAETVLFANVRENSRYDGKNQEFRPREMGAAATGSGADLCHPPASPLCCQNAYWRSQV
jgi:hypothetical protein